MRILQVVQKPQRRGPEILSQRLDAAFRERGHASRTVFLYPYAGDSPLALGAEDVCLHGNERHFLETTLGFHPGLVRRLATEIRAWGPDIVQVNGSRSVKYGALASRLAPGRSWRLVYRNIDNPDYWVRDPVRQAFYRYLVMPRMDGVVSVSRGMIEVLRRRYSFDVPLVYIPYVVDPARLGEVRQPSAAREALGVEADVPLVLFVGALSEQKRPDRFLRVVDRLRHEVPGVRAWVLGDGPLAVEVRDQREQLGLEGTVELLGYRSAVADYMAAADLLLISSDSDGIPTVVQEAGYLGTPVVATRVGGMDECVLEGETGFLADPSDEAGLAEAATRILRDPHLRDTLGAAAGRLVRSEFTIETAAQRHLDFFAELLGGSGVFRADP